MKDFIGTRATLETMDGVVVVHSPRVDLALPELLELVIVPLLRGAGYAEATIEDAMGER